LLISARSFAPMAVVRFAEASAYSKVNVLKFLVALPLIGILNLLGWNPQRILTLLGKQKCPPPANKVVKRSSLRSSTKLHWRTSSVRAVALTKRMAKHWAATLHSMHENAPFSSLDDTTGAPQHALITEFQLQMYAFPPLYLTSIALLDATERDGILGERLFRLVSNIDSLHAGKITGMLLELDDTEVLEILTPSDPLFGANTLMAWVSEAISVLQDAWQGALPKAPPPSPHTPADSEWQVVRRRRDRTASGTPMSCGARCDYRSPLGHAPSHTLPTREHGVDRASA